VSGSRAPPPDYVYLPNTMASGPPPPHYQPHPAGSAHYAPPMEETAEAAAGGDLIYDIRENDVLCGRGAPTTYHPGNQFFKDLVTKYQPTYIASRRSDKPQIATQIVDIVRGRGGRFLKRTKRPGLGPSGHFCWEDVGDQRAYEKACQALRENAPEIRRRIAAEEIAAISVDSESPPTSHKPARISDETAASLSGRKRASQDEDDTRHEESDERAGSRSGTMMVGGEDDAEADHSKRAKSSSN